MGRSKTLRAGTPRARQRGPLERERIIADALVDVATELRLADAAELILMIRSDHAANIADLVRAAGPDVRGPEGNGSPFGPRSPDATSAMQGSAARTQPWFLLAP